MRYALDALRRRPGRSLLTALGVGLASGLVVLLLALSAGVQTSATTLAYSSGVDLLATSSAGGNGSLLNGVPPPIPHAHNLTTEIPSVDPNAAVASPWLLGDLVLGNASLWKAANTSSVPATWTYTGSGAVGWIPDELAGIETPTLYNGTGFTDAGDPHYQNGSYLGPATHQIVLDQALAGVLGVHVGQAVWASPVAPPSDAALPGWYANATEFTVVGISGAFWLVPSAELAFVYLSELQQLLGGASSSTDNATLVLIHLRDPTEPAVDQAKVAAAFGQLSVYTLANLLGEIQHVVNVYRTFGTLIGAIGYGAAAALMLLAHQISAHHAAWAFGAICFSSFTKDLGMAATWAITIDIGHRYSGSVSGLMNAFGNMGQVLSPLVVVQLAILFGTRAHPNWNISLPYNAATFFIAALCFLLVDPRRTVVYSAQDRQRLEAEGALSR